MPEGDTVHRAARALAVLCGERLAVTAVHPRARAARVAERLDGRRLTGVDAHGKNLLLSFEGGPILRSHLGMRGSWRVLPSEAEIGGSPWLVLRGERAQAVLRGGSRIEVLAAPPRVGPDVLAERPEIETMARNVRSDPSRGVGDALLDQRLVSGIGNVWRSEALWHTRASPWRAVGEMRDEELSDVLVAAATLMRASVEGRRPRLAAYRRQGRPCPRCGTPIEAGRQGENARTVYWCPSCQAGNGAPGA